jgi:hypothetical protein
VRLYDPREDSFCWGSWILSDQAPRGAAVESTLMVYAVGLSCGFQGAHFDVRKSNEKVWQYHERFGAKRIGEDGDDFFYRIGKDAITRSCRHYASRIPDGVRIAW